jgi:peptidoglycan hydrolase-like protein with peptidoglycan-binding domain
MRAVRLLGSVAVAVALVSLAFWAGGVALTPLEDPIDTSGEDLAYTVSVDTVERSLSFTAVGEWVLSPVGWNGSSGVVTSVELGPGDSVGVGDALYSVDLRPAIIAEGVIPMFRSLALRSEGADVAQLQELLSELGFYQGEPDGSFGGSTRTAVKKWQDSLGVDDDGVVQAGDIVFVPSLPARVVLADTVSVGARLSGGEEVVLLVPDAPVFTIPLAAEQASLVPLSADVEVVFGAGVWEATIDRAVEIEFGQLDLVLIGSDGGSVCTSECVEWVDLEDPTSFRAIIIIIPETTGSAVPVAAIGTDPGNNTFVILADGSLRPVTIIESANGLAIVEGIDAGTEILIPADES